MSDEVVPLPNEDDSSSSGSSINSSGACHLADPWKPGELPWEKEENRESAIADNSNPVKHARRDSVKSTFA